MVHTSEHVDNTHSPQSRRTTPVRTVAWTAVTILVLAMVVALLVGIPVVRSRSVAFYVDGAPVTTRQLQAMKVDLAFDKTSDYYGTRVDIMDPSDPKTTFLNAALGTEAVKRLVIMHAQKKLAQELGLDPSAAEVETAFSTYVLEHAMPGDAADAASYDTPEVRAYVALTAAAKAYETYLQEAVVSVTPAELQDYYALWGWKETDAAGDPLTLEANRTFFENKALANKRYQVLLTGRETLFGQYSSRTQGDTRYKQFRRWWAIMFGNELPSDSQPLVVESGT